MVAGYIGNSGGGKNVNRVEMKGKEGRAQSRLFVVDRIERMSRRKYGVVWLLREASGCLYVERAIGQASLVSGDEEVP